MERIAFGDSASKQAVTQVNAEQASKIAMWKPTHHTDGEGRRGRRLCLLTLSGEDRATKPCRSTGVRAMACLREETKVTQETPHGGRA